MNDLIVALALVFLGTFVSFLLGYAWHLYDRFKR